MVLLSVAVSPVFAADHWVADSMENIFRDTPLPTEPRKSVSMIAARNESESAQICVRAAADLTIESVTFSDLTAGDDRVPNTNLSYQFVEFVHYETNSVGLLNPVRVAPADFPDAFSGERSIGVAAGTTQPIWVTVDIPKGQAPGIYEGRAVISTTAGGIEVPIGVEVVGAQVPDVAEGFYNAPMFELFYEDGDAIERKFGHPRYSPPWWEVLGKMCDHALANRTNVAYIVQHQLLLDGGSKIRPDGSLDLNWSRFDEVMNFLVRRGFRAVWTEGLASSDSDEQVWVNTIGGDSDGSGWDEALAGSEAANRFLDQFLPALESHLEAKGWVDKFFMQILDDPGPLNTTNGTSSRTGFLREFG